MNHESPDSERVDEYVDQLRDEFGGDTFTSEEACDVLDIDWSTFMETFVNLQATSGLVQQVGTKRNESVYRVVGDA